MTGKPILLIVEDDPGLQRQLTWCFDAYEVLIASGKEEAITLLRRHEPSVVLQDLGLPPDPEGVSAGFEALTEILTLAPHTKVIVVTGNNDRDNAVRAVGAGACDFYQKPIDVDVLRLIVARAFHIHALEQQNRELREMQAGSTLEGIIATDPAMSHVCKLIEKVAPADVSVLLLGESGTGKELLAKAIHRLSTRRDGKFVAINCAAIPEQLLESELFGHERGAFTGAIKQVLGKAEVAAGGTLFLDEIGDLPIGLQPKLLRFLQDRTIERIGGRQVIPIDVRIICATNQNLESRIAEGHFRQDLFFRVSEVAIRVPPLRERAGAPTVLAHAFLHRFGALHGRPRRGFTREAIEALESYNWPGNIRELENRVKTAVILAEDPMITVADLALPAATSSASPLNLREARAAAEKQAVAAVVASTEGNLSRAAELLGVSRPTLYDLVERYKINVPK